MEILKDLEFLKVKYWGLLLILSKNSFSLFLKLDETIIEQETQRIGSQATGTRS